MATKTKSDTIPSIKEWLSESNNEKKLRGMIGLSGDAPSETDEPEKQTVLDGTSAHISPEDGDEATAVSAPADDLDAATAPNEGDEIPTRAIILVADDEVSESNERTVPIPSRVRTASDKAGRITTTSPISVNGSDTQSYSGENGEIASSALGDDGDAIVEPKVDAALDTGNETSERSGDTALTESGTYTSVTGGDAMSTNTIPTPQSENPEPTASTSDSRIIAETQLIVPATDSDSTKRTVKQRKSDLSEYRTTFLPVPKIIDRKPVFVSHSTRDRLDRIVRLLGERGMSVSGLVENIAMHHLIVHEANIEHWRKM
jgi:hypothetical protein